MKHLSSAIDVEVTFGGGSYSSAPHEFCLEVPSPKQQPSECSLLTAATSRNKASARGSGMIKYEAGRGSTRAMFISGVPYSTLGSVLNTATGKLHETLR